MRISSKIMRLRSKSKTTITEQQVDGYLEEKETEKQTGPTYSDAQVEPECTSSNHCCGSKPTGGDLRESFDSSEIHSPPNTSMQSNHVNDVVQRLRKPTNKSHSKYVITGLQLSSAFLVLLYFVVPTVIRIFPSIIAEIAFLNKVRWPPFVNLSNPEEFGLKNTRSFDFQTENDVTVGAWHTLPESLQRPDITDQDYVKLLGNGSPVILYFHGNAGTRGGWHRVQLYKLLSKAGFHVITLDYRGYGDSSSFPTEDGVCHDAFTMFKWLSDQIGDSPMYIWGHSMGTGVATKVSKRICEEGLKLDALFLEAPFNNIIEAATHHPFSQPFKFLPWFTWGFVEAMKYNKILFSSDTSIAKVTVPTLIMHAKDDGIVPYSLGRKLYETALTTKTEGRVEMVTFAGSHGYGHKHIHKAPELVEIIWNFIKNKDSKIAF